MDMDMDIDINNNLPKFLFSFTFISIDFHEIDAKKWLAKFLMNDFATRFS